LFLKNYNLEVLKSLSKCVTLSHYILTKWNISAGPLVFEPLTAIWELNMLSIYKSKYLCIGLFKSCF